MSYRELAAQQHGFLLRSQLTAEEIQDAHQTGFIIDDYPLQSEHVFPTQLSSTATNYGYYWLWLLAFPTVPPEQRNPMPYFASGAALDVQQIGWGSHESPVFIVMPLQLTPYINADDGIVDDFIIDAKIQPTDWSLVDGIPVENILPALQKYLLSNDDFENAADAVFDAHDKGCSWEDLASVLEVCTGLWPNRETGKTPQTGKEVLEHFFQEYALPDPDPEDDDYEDFTEDEDDAWWS